MTDWIPLFESLVWPVFFAVLILFNRRWFKDILGTINRRIAEGGEVGLGPGGLTLGAVPRLPDSPAPEEIIDDDQAATTRPELAQEAAIERKEETDPLDSLELVHRSSFLRVNDGRDYYRIVIALDTPMPGVLSRVTRVVYFLHHTFKNPVREVVDASNNFALTTAAWGEFTIRADVYVRDRDTPIRLSRYLNIEARRG